MLIYNTLSRNKEELKPSAASKFKMYVCGPTVYDYDHLGHARVGIFYDFLKRFLQSQGFSVKYVQNITDVGHLTEDSGEDKIEKQARKEKIDPKEIAEKYTKAHFHDMRSLNVAKPDFSPRASQYVSQIIDFIKVLVKKGYAYQSAGNVYFDVSRFPSYGQLSGRKVSDQLEAGRIEPGEGKKSPADFALWIKASPGHLLKYSSPWSEGYPGWHIECSVMNHEFFGEVTDIHGGANELTFPHHENEVAQSQAYSGKKPVCFFVHIGMVTINGEKMSKSKGNVILIRDLTKKYDADTIRLFIFKSYYRSPIDYSVKNMAEAEKIKEKLVRAKEAAKSGPRTKISQKIAQILTDDLNTAAALTFILDNSVKAKTGDWQYIEEIFGLKLAKEKIILSPVQKKLIKDREEAREKKDWKTADEIRRKLQKEGISLEDTEKGTKVRGEKRIKT